MDRIINERKVDVLSSDDNLESLLALIKHQSKINLTGEADEPVTSDIKRLIRLPGSLHAKTGLAAMLLKIDGLKGFDPLTDAVPSTLSDKGVKLVGLLDEDVKVKDFHVKIEKGNVIEVPEYAALFLVCRRVCAPA